MVPEDDNISANGKADTQVEQLMKIKKDTSRSTKDFLGKNSAYQAMLMKSKL